MAIEDYQDLYVIGLRQCEPRRSPQVWSDVEDVINRTDYLTPALTLQALAVRAADSYKAEPYGTTATSAKVRSRTGMLFVQINRALGFDPAADTGTPPCTGDQPAQRGRPPRVVALAPVVLEDPPENPSSSTTSRLDHVPDLGRGEVQDSNPSAMQRTHDVPS